MIIARFIKPESHLYKTLANQSKKMDVLMSLKPFTWFAIWIMMTSGTSAQQQIVDRFSYWDMSLAWNGTITMIVVAGIMTWVIGQEKIFFTKLNLNISTLLNHCIMILMLFFTGWGWLNVFQGELMIALKSFIPYLCSYFAVLLGFQISIDSIPENGYKPGKSFIFISFILSLLGVALGILFEDPVISTASAVVAPFYLIAIIFPEHKRHIERCRTYPLFICLMFVSVRLPWVLIPSSILFFVLRTYHYFRYQIVYPTFAVDHD